MVTQISNLIQMNDWEIAKFLKVILSIQLLMWCLIGLDALNLQIPILRQLVSLIYLLFVPGILILRILRLHKIGNVRTILFALGLSIATLMSMGLIINTAYPLLGISKPISFFPLIVTINVIVLSLCFLCYKRDREFSSPSYVNIRDIISPYVLFLCIIPFLAILGAYLMNFYKCNNLLMFLTIIIAVIPIFIATQNFAIKGLYPMAVFVVSISLLLQKSLISNYLTGWDIQLEYSTSAHVVSDSYWNQALPDPNNAMLYLVMFPPIFHYISGISLIWFFKIIQQFLFSLVPVGLYHIYKEQTNERIAFFSCFFFSSVFTFHGEMTQLAKQQVAMLFLVLLMLIIIEKDMSLSKRSLLAVVFAFSVVVSHYGISYVFMLLFIVACSMLLIVKKFLSGSASFNSGKNNLIITPNFVLIFTALALGWYIYIAASSNFVNAVNIFDHIISNIHLSFFNPEYSEAARIVLTETTQLREVGKILHNISQFFIVFGIFWIFLKKEFKFNMEYLICSILCLMLLASLFLLPYAGFGTARLYLVMLLFLAPYCVIGGLTLFKILIKFGRKFSQHMDLPAKLFSAFLLVFLLFNTGFVFEIAEGGSGSISLNANMDYPKFNEQEFKGGEWLINSKGNRVPVFSDEYRAALLAFFGLNESIVFPDNIKMIAYYPNFYVFLGKVNIKDRKLVVLVFKPPRNLGEVKTFEDLSFDNLLSTMNKIYDSADSQIYCR